MKEYTVRVYQCIGSSTAVATSDGKKVFDMLSTCFSEKVKTTLDFSGIDLVTSAFLNASVGKLYGIYTSEDIKNYLQVSGLESDDIALLQEVIDRAKEYFSDKEKVENAINKAMDE